MEKLLQWSIAQQSGDKEAIEKIGAPDPEVLKQVFGGGPDEPTLMKQAILVVQNPEATAENKEIALENFEMLIENLDNANNIQNLKLWPAIIQQLDASVAASRDIRVLAASIIGIAVQNNPDSQAAFLQHDGGLAKLIEIATPATGEPRDLYLKALFALSSLVRNDPASYTLFNQLNGWDVLAPLADPATEAKVKLRLLSLLSALISTNADASAAGGPAVGKIDADKQANLHDYKIIGQLVTILSTEKHTGCIDKVLNIISTLYAQKFEFSAAEVAGIRDGLRAIEPLKDDLSEEDHASAKQVVS